MTGPVGFDPVKHGPGVWALQGIKWRGEADMAEARIFKGWPAARLAGTLSLDLADVEHVFRNPATPGAPAGKATPARKSAPAAPAPAPGRELGRVAPVRHAPLSAPLPPVTAAPRNDPPAPRERRPVSAALQAFRQFGAGLVGVSAPPVEPPAVGSDWIPRYMLQARPFERGGWTLDPREGGGDRSWISVTTLDFLRVEAVVGGVVLVRVHWADMSTPAFIRCPLDRWPNIARPVV